MSTPLRAAVILVGLMAVACGDAGEQRTGAIVTAVDGVLRVQLPRDHGGVPTWTLTEIHSTAPSGSDIELFRVTSARFLEDGSLAVANAGTREVLLLDADGALSGRFGRQGSGPGEFEMMSALDVDASGNLTVYDPGELRLTRFSTAGDVLDVRRLSSEGAVSMLYPLAELADGRFTATSDRAFSALRALGRTEETRDTMSLFVVDPDGAPPDTVGVWAADEWANYAFSGGVTRRVVGFGRTLALAGRSGRTAVGSTDSLDITVLDEDGRVAMRIAGWGPVEAVTVEDLDRWRNDLVERGSRAPEELQRWYPTVPHRSTYPAFRDLLLDSTGRVWIGMYPRADQPQSWIVVGTDGRLEGQVAVPADSRLLDAADDRVAMLRRGEMDEEYVVVTRLAPGT